MKTMSVRKGSIQVSTENIFPVIRQWLYTDRDIFVRELVSNAADAITKLERLRGMGEWNEEEKPSYRIDIEYDSKAGTIKVSDNGLGMNEDEIDEYINQIAYSGAMAFVQKYQEKGDAAEGVIGHFGLGFYSSFMVADKVRIDSLSWKKGETPAFWQSDDGTGYSMGPGEKETRGTAITLSLNEEAKAEFDGYKLREILKKYCQFMPYPIYFKDVTADEERLAYQLEQWQKRQDEAAAKGEEKPAEEKPVLASPQQINDTEPLWLKDPKDVTDEEYKKFYHTCFQDYRDPLFWIHLNMDYPFRLKGILYFPEAEEHYDTLAGRIKVYYNQVFVADDVREMIPDYLFLLRGAIDSPELPLNVSRSALQTNSALQKLSTHIVRKVADKLTALAKNEREAYEKYWDDISLFVRYGSLRDEKFFDRVKDALLFKLEDGRYLSMAELREGEDEKVYYVTEPKRQVAYVERLKAQGRKVFVMTHEFDVPFLQMIAVKEPKPRFVRADAEVEGEAGNEARKDQLTDIFREATGAKSLEIEVKALGPDGEPAILTEDEQAKSMLEMRKMFRKMEGKTGEELDEMFPIRRTLVVNTDQSLITKLCLLQETAGKEEQAKELAREIYDLARLSHGSLEAEELAAFLKRSAKILGQISL